MWILHVNFPPPDGVCGGGAVLDNRIHSSIPVEEEGDELGLAGGAEGDVVLAEAEEGGHVHGETGLQLQPPRADVVGPQHQLALLSEHLPPQHIIILRIVFRTKNLNFIIAVKSSHSVTGVKISSPQKRIFVAICQVYFF